MAVLKTKAGIPWIFADDPGDDLQCLGEIRAAYLKDLMASWRAASSG